jgi:ABC-type nickel/cobalt efflux system permease component RcnA
MDWLYAVQANIRGALVGEFSRYAANPDLSLLIWFIPLGILFGAVHALTPGHSKTVVASYVLGSRLSVLKSLGVSGALAFVHVASAVVIALTAAALVRRTIGGAGRAPALEILSGALLIVLGLWLLWRGLSRRTHIRGEGLLVGIAAGLIPCPLTLFAMVLAQSRGVPEAGIAFAGMMMIGVAITLSAVAAATAFARDRLVAFLRDHGERAAQVLRAFDLMTGALLVIAGAWRLAG